MNRKLLLKVLSLRKIQKKKKRKSRSMCIRQIFLNRNINGESALVEELKHDPHYHNRYFRMRRNNFEEILGRIKRQISHPENHLRPISPTERLAITLRYLATGNSQVSLALNYRVSPSSVSKIIRETTQAICNEMKTEQLHNPSEKIWKLNEKLFSTKWNFHNACGALDGKHIRIVAPSKSSSLFYNYKSFFSIVMLAVVGPNYIFTAVDIGSSGSQSDGGILMNSAMGKRLLNETFKIPAPKKHRGRPTSTTRDSGR